MKITNKYNLPATIVNALHRPTYNKGGANLSVTQLINSPKIVALTKRHQDDLEEDAADMVWSLFGSAVHNILEHGKDPNHRVEERIHCDIGGWHISGAVDLQVYNEDGTISIKDYKVTSSWAVMNQKSEWTTQLNVYAWLVALKTGKAVRDLAIVAICRDWSRRDAANREGYPQAPIVEIPIEKWSLKEQKDYLDERIKIHSECEFHLDTGGEPMDCTPDEMWEKPTVYALKKVGGVRAKSLHENQVEAQIALEAAGKGYEIEVRPGERTRCASFCNVAPFCKQYQTYLKGE